MKCPLYVMACFDREGIVDSVEVECDKEECAWWDSGYERCSVRDIAVSLDDLGKVFSIIVAKMPHAGQFLK